MEKETKRNSIALPRSGGKSIATSLETEAYEKLLALMQNYSGAPRGLITHNDAPLLNSTQQRLRAKLNSKNADGVKSTSGQEPKTKGKLVTKHSWFYVKCKNCVFVYKYREDDVKLNSVFARWPLSFRPTKIISGNKLSSWQNLVQLMFSHILEGISLPDVDYYFVRFGKLRKFALTECVPADSLSVEEFLKPKLKISTRWYMKQLFSSISSSKQKHTITSLERLASNSSKAALKRVAEMKYYGFGFTRSKTWDKDGILTSNPIVQRLVITYSYRHGRTRKKRRIVRNVIVDYSDPTGPSKLWKRIKSHKRLVKKLIAKSQSKDTLSTALDTADEVWNNKLKKNSPEKDDDSVVFGS